MKYPKRRLGLRNATLYTCLIFSTVSFASLQAGASKDNLKLLQAFDYEGVTLLDSRFEDQFQASIDYYLSVSNDDILCGYRESAGLDAPGHTLGGWCARNSDTVFGQWLSGMARVYKATGNTALLDKAKTLLNEWEKTIGEDGDCHMDLYAYDKVVCGLVDLNIYADISTLPLLKKTLYWAMDNFTTERTLETPYETSGKPGEWYTFAENLYRAYDVLKDPKVKAFADSYLHPEYWNKFKNTADPENAYNLHAYSHVNSFSSLAKAYEETGDDHWLQSLIHAYDFMQDHQCFATGGYGPMERILPSDGTLGQSVEARNASFETVCGSWAGFKMCRYLTEFTGDARYGDWMEKLFYNGVGSALPITDGGKHFYYSDYRVTGGMKVYKVSRYSCCSGSLIQCVADYHNLIYYHAPDALYVNLYVPSKVKWSHDGQKIEITQLTHYPEEETADFTVSMNRADEFEIAFRVPSWTTGLKAEVNGKTAKFTEIRDGWAVLKRQWKPEDTIRLTIPMKLKMQPIDNEHPRRVAITHGPVVLAMDDWVFETIPSLPEPKDLEDWLIPDDENPGVFKIAPQGDKTLSARFRPFYMFGEVVPYRIYFDLDSEPIPVWGLKD